MILRALSVLVVCVFCCLAMAMDAPQQIHLALAGRTSDGTSNGMSVMWQTQYRTETSVVEYGVSPSSLDMKATGECSTYLETYDHLVILSDLKEATTYYYRCGDATQGFSDVYSFKTAPSSKDSHFTAFVWGDLGYGTAGHAVDTLNFLQKTVGEGDLYWHTGDISYADDAFLHYLNFSYERVYNDYMNAVQPFAAKYPYMVLPGNHESECHSIQCLFNKTRSEALRNFTAYNHRFRMPHEESGSPTSMWYSFNYGNAHFVCFDTETDYKGAPEFNHGDSGLLPAGHFAPNGTQMKWFEADLAAAAADRANGIRPWIIVAGHRPVYTDGRINFYLEEMIEPLLIKYKVDLYIAGHEHSYMRSWPTGLNASTITHSYDNPSNPVHLVVGGAGCDEMKPTGARLRGQSNWTATANAEYAMGKLTFMGDSMLQFELYATANNSVIDKFTLVKDHSGSSSLLHDDV